MSSLCVRILFSAIGSLAATVLLGVAAALVSELIRSPFKSILVRTRERLPGQNQAEAPYSPLFEASPPEKWKSSGLRALLMMLAAAGALALSLFSDGFDAVSLAWHLVATVLGWGIGTTLTRGRRAVITISLSLLFSMACLTVVGLWLATESTGMPDLSFAPSRTSPDGLRNLIKDLPRSSSARWELKLAPDDVNAVFNSTRAVMNIRATARLDLVDELLIANASIPFHVAGIVRFVNIRGGAELIGDGERPRFRMRFLTLGRLAWPGFLVRRMGRAASQWIHDHPRLSQMDALIDRAAVVDGRIHLEGSNAPELRRLALGGIHSRPAHTVSAANVQRCVALLAESAEALPPGDARFCGLLKVAFSDAASRSALGDPVEENRIALVALAVAIGDNNVGVVAGVAAEEGLSAFPYKIRRDITLHGRRDLALHFVVSAALTSLASDRTADSAGFTKEYLDAQVGGTGFSFADLTADRSGVQFARTALGSRGRARELQSRVDGVLSSDDLMPAVEGLTEAVDAEALFEDYGSYSDPRFLAAVEEIDARVARCALYR